MGAALPLFPQAGVSRAPGGSGSARKRAETKGAFTTPDFQTLLGDAAWASLPAAVRARFGHAAERETRVYPGAMTVRANAVGRLLAQLCRLIGTPFAPWTGDAIPVAVNVSPAPGGGLVWARTYAFPGHAPIRVTSRKLQDADGSLLELVDGGLGMRIALSADGADLIFTGERYVWSLGSWLIPIPAFLTPGRAVMIHRDLGGGAFAFIMTFTHPLAGELFFQSGVFQDPTP